MINVPCLLDVKHLSAYQLDQLTGEIVIERERRAAICIDPTLTAQEAADWDAGKKIDVIKSVHLRLGLYLRDAKEYAEKAARLGPVCL